MKKIFKQKLLNVTNFGKKMCASVIIFMIFVSCFYGRINFSFEFVRMPTAYAQTQEEEEISEQLSEQVETQLSNLDFSEVEMALNKLDDEAKSLFASNSFSEKLKSVISGEYASDSKSFFAGVTSLLFGDLKSYMPIVATIISISILGGMIANIKPVTSGKSIGNIVHFVTFGIVVIFLGTSLTQIVKNTTSTLFQIKNIFDGIFPILLTLLTAAQGTAGVGVYQPAFALLTNIIVGLITYFLLPIFIFSLVFSIVGNLSNNIKLDKFVGFLQGTFKWAIGLFFTIFLGFVSIQGLMAGAFDGISIKTAKYAIKSYVPIVGGYVSDGLSIILASSVLIKNAVGGVGLFLLLSTVIAPALNLVTFMLALKFMAGVTEPIGDHKIANFISEISKSMSLLVALLVTVAFMYLVLTGLVIASANVI